MKHNIIIQQKFFFVIVSLGLLLAGLWLTPVAQAQTGNINCTNGVGDTRHLIASINSANEAENQDILILGQNCIYTPVRSALTEV